MDIIVKNGKSSPNYWCTWATQNAIAEQVRICTQVTEESLAFLGDQGAGEARHMLNEEILFGERFALAYQFPEIRHDLYLVLDDGWDVPYGIHPDKSKCRFGSLVLDAERFPSYTGTPAERLKKLNETVKQAGWRGLGLWIAAQRAGADYLTPFEEDTTIEDYFRERILWSREADIAYWKVDWGTHCNSVAFRKMLTDLACELYPTLIIEHAACMYPLNGSLGGKETRFFEDRGTAARARDIARISEVFRSYDYLGPLAVATTLDRLAFLLREERCGIVNCEDMEYIGAVMGCALGLMKAERFTDRRSETIAAIRWLSMAPAFSGGDICTSEAVKEDRYFFAEGSTWLSRIIGKEAVQGAPLAMSRNMPLPVIEGEDPPYVCACKNPNGAYALGAFKSTSDRHERAPRITLSTPCAEYVGIFGDFEQVTLCTERTAKRVYLQSLIRGEAIEIDEAACGDRVVLSRNRLMSVYPSIDRSENAVVVKIEY